MAGQGRLSQIHAVGDPNTAGAAVTASLQSTVFVHGRLVAVHGSPVAGHPPGAIHGAPTTSHGSPTVFIGGRGVNGQGDPDTCGHPRAAGSPSVYVDT